MSATNVRSIRATVLAVPAACIVPAGTAHARLLFWPQWGYWSGDQAPSRQNRHRHAEPKSAKKDQVQDAPNGPLQIIISIADQRISVYDNGALIGRSSVSTGIPRHPTPLGVFSVISKQRWHRSNLYSAAPMPYMQRITWSGMALHAGVLPGYPASHGCIRLKNDFAIRLWHLTKRGTRVIIATSEVEPIEVTSPRLFAPKPKIASGPLATAIDGAPETIGEAVKSAAATAVANPENNQSISTQIPELQRAGPQKRPQISVFVSRKENKLYVRQSFVPLFDSPVTINDPERPLGTHIFTALAFNPEDPVVRWTVVSMPEGDTEVKDKMAASQTTRRVLARSTMKPPSTVRTPERAIAALDRIEIPNSPVDRISELLSPGASLIVSDQGISSETGRDTDFIVLTPK